MALNLQVPQQPDEFRPRICVIGVGGAGGNAVNNMIASGLEGVEFLVCNTDAQDLAQSLSDNRLQLGPTVTKGLGAGMQPSVGAEAAQESMEEILHRLDGANMVFITAGMGGGTGTGAAPVIAQALRERNILTVGVVTKPFQFEGLKRSTFAEEGLANLAACVDTLIVIPNQNLFRLANEKTTFADAFKMADNVLLDGVRGVSDLIVKPGIVNLDFADVRTLMTVMGKAMMGTGEAEGETRALEAAERAIANPLLDDMSLDGAQGVLINVTGGYDVTLYEVDAVANHVREKVDPDANIIFGSSVDESMTGTLRVSVVATGIDADQMRAARAMPATSPHGMPSHPGPGGPSGPAGGPGGGMPVAPSAPQPQSAPSQPGSPFGRSPFAFRSNNRDQGPTSAGTAGATAMTMQGTVDRAPFGHTQRTAMASSPSPSPLSSASATPHSIGAMSSPTPETMASQNSMSHQSHVTSQPASQGTSFSSHYAPVPPASASTPDMLPRSAPNVSEADLFGNPASSPQMSEANAAPKMGGMFTRAATPTAPTYGGGAAVAAVHNIGLEETDQRHEPIARQVAPSHAQGTQDYGHANLAAPPAAGTPDVQDLDAPAMPSLASQELDAAPTGPRVLDIDDSADSGLQSFDQKYKSVPAFLRKQNN